MQPEASQPPVSPLAALPEGIFEDILLRSRHVHARQVCRAFRAIIPLRSLAPHSIETPEQLAAAIAALPLSLATLDLRHVGSGAVTPEAMSAMTALRVTTPHLQRLAVRCTSHTELSAFINDLHHLPHLHTLRLLSPGAEGSYNQPPEVLWPTLLQTPIATRLRALALPISALPALHTAPSCAFPQLTTLSFLKEAGWLGSPDVGNQASLLGPVPFLRRLRVERANGHHARAIVGQLTALTVLTALSFAINLQPATEPLPSMGTLTGLRRLQLAVDHFPLGGHPSVLERGWLQRLALLTHLDLSYAFVSSDDAPLPPLDEPLPAQARVISELVQAAVALPQLRDLRLEFAEGDASRFELDWLACGTVHSFFSHLATATRLRRLGLCGMPLPSEEACLLSRLQGLTSLHLQYGRTQQAAAAAAAEQPRHDGVAAAPAHGGTGAGGVHWVAALTGLRELAIEFGKVPRLVQAVAALPHLHKLALRTSSTAWRQRQLPELLDKLQGVLVQLELGMGLVAMWDDAVLRSLGSMTHLRDLTLAPTKMCEKALMLQISMDRLLLPRSLVTCYVVVPSDRPPHCVPGVHPADWARALRQLQERYPWVSIKPHARP